MTQQELTIVQFTDGEGYKRQAYVRAGGPASENPSWGIPCGVPILINKGLPLSSKEILTLNNTLFDQGLFTYDDVLHAKGGLTNTLIKMGPQFKVVKRQLIIIYKIAKLASGGSNG